MRALSSGAISKVSSPSGLRAKQKACLTCKIRRVRCSYETPSCQRCVSTGRRCDGYPRSPADDRNFRPVAILVVTHRNVSTLWDHDEVYSFQFFVESCVPALSNFGSRPFWSQTVLKACHHSEGIRLLTIAASQLSRQRRQGIPGDTDYLSFLSYYGRGLRSLTRLSHKPESAIILIATLLLILCDEFQNNSFGALQHLMAGRRILTSLEDPLESASSSPTMRELGSIFAALELQTGEVNYQVKSGWHWHSGRQIWLNSNIQHFAHPASDQVPWSDAVQGAEELQSIAFECISTKLDGPSPATRFHTVPGITTKLNDWLDRCTLYQHQMQDGASWVHKNEMRMLRAYHLCLHIISRCQPYGDEAAWDVYLNIFEHLITSCTFMVPNMKARILPVLFFVATRYRDASIRRQAICMLNQCGIDGQLLATVAIRVLKVEERCIWNPIVCADISMENRVVVIGLTLGPDSTGYVLQYRRANTRVESGIETVPLGGAWKLSCSCGNGMSHAVSLDVSRHTRTANANFAAQSDLVASMLKFDFMSFWHHDDPAFTMPAAIRDI
jgi:hypothetical protein